MIVEQRLDISTGIYIRLSDGRVYERTPQQIRNLVRNKTKAQAIAAIQAELAAALGADLAACIVVEPTGDLLAELHYVDPAFRVFFDANRDKFRGV